MKHIVGFGHAKAGPKFIILQSELTKIDLKAYNISGDCTSLYSARFSTTTHKSHSSLSLVLFMQDCREVAITAIFRHTVVTHGLGRLFRTPTFRSNYSSVSNKCYA